MKKMFATAAVFALAVGLTACSANPGYSGNPQSYTVDTLNNNNSLQSYTVPTGDGRQVTCIVYDGPSSGALSCDWAGAE